MYDATSFILLRTQFYPTLKKRVKERLDSLNIVKKFAIVILPIIAMIIIIGSKD